MRMQDKIRQMGGFSPKLRDFLSEVVKNNFDASVKLIKSSDDLPEAVNGDIQLEDNIAYYFENFITTPYSIVLGLNTPLIGLHGGKSGFIHTGQTTALKGQGKPLLMRDLSVSAPGGTLFDLDGEASECLVESCSFSDFANLGEFAGLGTIANFRVPSFKGSNFENFAAGLTLTGNPDKVYFEGCPLRTVTQPNVTIINFDSNFETDIIDMPNNYVKGVQPDTEVIKVDPAAVINDIFQYTGNTHDSTVETSNILTGAAGANEVGYRVVNSYPLANSRAIINYTLDAQTTTAITTQATDKFDAEAYVRVAGSTTSYLNFRFTHSNNLATYIGKKIVQSELKAALSLGTGTDDVIAIAWFRDGNLIENTATRVKMTGRAGGVDVPGISIGVCSDCQTGSEYDVRIANLGSTTDIQVGELNVNITAGA